MTHASPRSHLTKQAVDRLKPGQTLRDSELRGFGVRCQSGVRSYFLQRKVNGRLVWITIGVHGEPWTPDTARRQALRLLAEITCGGDPRQRRREERDQPNVTEAAEQFLAVHGRKLKPRTHDEYRRLIARHITPRFGGRMVADITKGDVARFHAGLSHIPAMANFALAVLSKLMNWCEDMGYRPEHSNPCRRVGKYRQNRRERYLTHDELTRLGRVLAEVDITRTVSLFASTAIRLLLLTGARLNEILTLQWAHVDLERRLLLLPDSKTGQKPIRLSEQAAAVLHSTPHVKGNPYVIVGQRAGHHLVNLEKPWRLVRRLADLDDVRIHDLRHTFASIAAASGGSLPMIGALLGHSQPSTTQRYAHLAHDPVQRLNQNVGDVIASALASPTTPGGTAGRAAAPPPTDRTRSSSRTGSAPAKG